MASGRLRVMVATPASTSSRTGSVEVCEEDMAAVCPIRRTRGSGPRRPPRPGPAGRPRAGSSRWPGRPAQSSGQQLVRQPRVGEEELAPLVHQVEAGGERRLLGVLVRGEVGLEVGGRLVQPRGVLRPDARRGPTPASGASGGSKSSARAVVAVAPARRASRRGRRGPTGSPTPGRPGRRSPGTAGRAAPRPARRGRGRGRAAAAASSRPTRRRGRR